MANKRFDQLSDGNGTVGPSDLVVVEHDPTDTKGSYKLTIAQLGALSGFPWIQNIIPALGVHSAHVGTWAAFHGATYFQDTIYENSSHTVNDSLTWPICLDSGGTYSLFVAHNQGSIYGIQTWKINGVTKGTIDGYNSGTTPAQVGSIAGMTSLPAGQTTLTMTVATKNASSSDYYVDLGPIAIVRTS